MAGEQVDQIMNMMNGTQGTTNASEAGSSKNSGQEFFCDAKSQSELNEFVNSEKPKLVALVGFADYGKSTFIGSLYQQLIVNLNYGGYSFVDSDTYVGFERRVFLRRINDDNISDTKRNILGENDILVFNLRSVQGKLHQIIVSDKAGETYSKYISSDEEIKKDIVLQSADLILFFVDAELDSKSLAEHNLIAEKYESILTRLKAKGKINEGTTYAVVFTKVDKVNTDERKKKLADRCEKIKQLFVELTGTEAEGVYEVNSRDLINESLNELFAKIISPKQATEAVKEIDWVKMEIENNQ